MAKKKTQVKIDKLGADETLRELKKELEKMENRIEELSQEEVTEELGQNAQDDDLPEDLRLIYEHSLALVKHLGAIVKKAADNQE